MVDFKKILEYDRLALKEVEKYPKKRFLFSSIQKEKGKHFVGIVGPRGVGKTVLLRQIRKEYKNSLYISLDTIKEDLFEIARKAKEDFETELLLLDEVHFYSGFEEVLKKIYDYLDLRVIFTSSVALVVSEAQYDLSRRVLLKKLYPFSFREYLFFKYDVKFPRLSLEDILNKKFDKEILSYSASFYDYLKGGLYPFSLEEPLVLDILKNICSKVVHKDIPRILDLKVGELEIIEKLISFIGKAKVEGISYSSVANNLKITRYKAQQYLNLLEKAFIINQVFPEGTNVLKEPKVLMSPPYRLLYSDFQECIGALREDFFVEMMRASESKTYYLKSTRGEKIPDFVIFHKGKKIVAEIGGKSKGRTQFKGFKGDKKIIFVDSCKIDDLYRPLFLVGFLV